MARLRTFLIAVLVSVFAGEVRAENVFPDAVFYAYVRAGERVAAGERRDKVALELTEALAKHPTSPHVNIARRLERDLTASMDKAAAREKAGRTLDEAPAEFLSETMLPIHLLAYPQNWEEPLPAFNAEHPRDPAVLLLQQGRKSIDGLMGQLANDSPTRAFDSMHIDMPKVPRVADLAINLIETLSHCKFHFNASTGKYFHELEPDKRAKTIRHITEWWRNNKGMTLPQGIRAQLPHGDFYAQITMAENLLRASANSSPEDRQHGLDVLRQKARSGAHHSGAQAARVLAKHGDLSPVEWYYDELKKSLDIRGREWGFTGDALFYLADYGGRKEWELLYQIAAKDLQQAEARPRESSAYVLGTLINSPKARTRLCRKTPYSLAELLCGTLETLAL